jgi:hypothetical protein
VCWAVHEGAVSLGEIETQYGPRLAQYIQREADVIRAFRQAASPISSALCGHTPRCRGHEDDIAPPPLVSVGQGDFAHVPDYARVDADIDAPHDGLSHARAGDLPAVMLDVTDERRRQDDLWGGPEHDDRHTWRDWLRILQSQLNKLAVGNVDPVMDLYGRLVRIAALSVAGMESCSRRARRANSGGVQ